MTYIFTAEQLAGVIQYNLKTEDPLILENVAFLAELFYQDCKDDIKNSQTNHGQNVSPIHTSKPMIMVLTNKPFARTLITYHMILN